MLKERTQWLARPWFFGAIALLALNDHVFKGAWPGVVTGKLSDFAGLVVVATVVSVLIGSFWGTVLSGLAFTALKTVPGVAELAAPLLGGVTLRDATDLVALIVLPALWLALVGTRRDQSARNRRGWAMVGLVAGLLATTATSTPMHRGVEELGYVGDSFYARVYIEDGDASRWIRSADGGATWTRAEAPGALPEATRLREVDGWQQCASDGSCVRVRELPAVTVEDHGTCPVERMSPQGVWSPYGDLGECGFLQALAVNSADSRQAVIGGEYRTYYRSSAVDWVAIDLVELAKDPQWQRDQLKDANTQSSPVLILLLASLLCWLVAPGRVAKRWLQVLNVLAFALVVLAGVWAPTSQADLLQLKAYWAFVVVVILVLMWLIWFAGRCISALPRSAAKPR